MTTKNTGAKSKTSNAKPDLPKLPDGVTADKARVLKLGFHNGRHYAQGSLALISDEDLPQFNSSANIMVINPEEAELLDRTGVTGPYE